MNFVPKMNAARLVEGYKTILRDIYSSRQYYKRAIDCLSRFKPDRIEPRRINPISDLKALTKILMTLGVRDKERLRFWIYLFRLVVFHPRDIAHGLTLAAMGYHFRKITMSYCE